MELQNIPIARNTDPKISLLSESLTNRRNRTSDIELLLGWVRRYPERTAMELCQIMISHGVPFYRVLTLHKRLSDAKQLNYVRNAGKRDCMQTGRLAGTWVIK